MRTVVIGLFVLGLLSGCTSETDARRALEAEGYRDIEITGYNFLACREVRRTGFVATNREGKQVNGTVCSDPYGTATIRY